ncbi:hypothetical protein RHSIM_Rhsim09G0098900 [Rhododendron simsii]|uniref:Uncharacterized protein n=1 Tax=Rhododendron simsii TaxID=118357 RepID=A0A834GH73_RHOSS|nr:hypothetical protein RHSIM_Rhsim09G0098900 [Rhododendron simsii]
MRKPCCEKQGTNKGAWSKQEDQKLVDYIRRHGEGCWRTLPQAAGLLRCGKSCRLRWINYLRPDLKRGKFAEDEEDLIIKLHALLGNRWSLIAGRLPGRTDNEVKNYWNSHLRRKLMNMGIDPKNHRLNQNLPRSQNRCASGCATTSSASKEIVSHPLKTRLGENDQLSEAASCLEDSTRCLPDLNLDLKITIDHSSSISIVEEEKKQIDESTLSRDSECDTRPTLLLFG